MLNDGDQPNNADYFFSRKPNKLSFILRFAREHIEAFIRALRHIFSYPFSSFFTMLAIGITLSFPTVLYSLLHNAEIVTHRWQEGSQITLFLKKTVSENDKTQLLTLLQHNSNIHQVKYISEDEGLSQFKEATQLDEVLGTFAQNPLPAVIEIHPSHTLSPEAIVQLTNTLKNLPEVEHVNVDQQWMERLHQIINFLKRATYLLEGAMTLGVCLVLSVMIRLAIQQHRHDLNVFKLVHATPRYIRRPFLYMGILYGISGGIIGGALVNFIISQLNEPVSALARSYQSDFQLLALTLTQVFDLFLFCAALGWLSARIATYWCLKKLNV